MGCFGPRSKRRNAFPVVEQKHFVVIIPSYNNAEWCEKNLRSVLEQKYDNYRIIYIDDCSKDGTGEKVKNFIANSEHKSRFSLIQNEKNRGAMANLYYAIHSCKNNEIAVILDGDDWLAHENVLNRLNEAYADPNIWLTYGSYVEFPSYKKGSCARVIPPRIIKRNKFRDYRWSASHLRSFYAGLFKQIKLQDFVHEGKFFDTTYDLAIMFPMLEMAGNRFRLISDVLYVYNRSNPISDDKIRFARQSMLDGHIRALPRYITLAALPAAAMSQQETADFVIFSYDRPMQLYSLLESVERNVIGFKQSSVVYRSSDKTFAAAYDEVKTRFPYVNFIKQGDKPAEDFKPLVMNAIFETPSKYVIFAVDDIIVKDFVDLNHCIQNMKQTGAYGFFLRLGSNVDYCYMLDQQMEVPSSIPLKDGVYAWQFQIGSADWKYPNTVDMTIYKKEDIKARLERIKFDTPFNLESHWMCKPDYKKIGLYYENSKMVNIPLNLVHMTGNRNMDAISTKELLRMFQAGLKIDIAPLHQINNRSAHIDQQLSFVPRDVHWESKR